MGTVTYTPQYNHPEQEQALIEFYDRTNGASWNINTLWTDTGVSYCTWYGVNCDSISNITGLNLSGNNLL